MRDTAAPCLVRSMSSLSGQDRCYFPDVDFPKDFFSFSPAARFSGRPRKRAVVRPVTTPASRVMISKTAAGSVKFQKRNVISMGCVFWRIPATARRLITTVMISLNLFTVCSFAVAVPPVDYCPFYPAITGENAGCLLYGDQADFLDRAAMRKRYQPSSANTTAETTCPIQGAG